jgi:hypothetical protein
MGIDIIEKILPGLPLIIARDAAIFAVIALLIIDLISIFC